MTWKSIKKEQPDPKLGCVLYRLRKSGQDRWFVGLCYFTVSGKWAIDGGGQSWPPDHGYNIEWMEIPL